MDQISYKQLESSEFLMQGKVKKKVRFKLFKTFFFWLSKYVNLLTFNDYVIL